MILSFSVWGDDLIVRDLLRFSGRAVNAMPAFYAMAEDMEDALEEQFDSEGRHASGGWAPLAAATVAQKAAENLDSRILHATLALRDSLTGGADQIKIATPSSLTFGSKVPYGKYHQTGTTHMPRRRPIEFTEIEKRGFTRTLQRYIVEGDLGVAALA